mmetsp:Transcript_30186/g.26649  ORF Transcript_30186/g.26649 Transcript_30186/m.26649 type:complete len:732 (+) Transcript_30186:38-2233(+)
MHYFSSAPRSPQGQARDPPRPPQNYNYATRNNNNNRPNPYSANRMQMPSQQPPQPSQQIRPNPYNANRLSEDRTIEDIEASSVNDNGGQKFITILIIGIIVVILLIGGGVGVYFMLKDKNKAAVSNASHDDSSSSSESGDSDETASEEGEYQEAGTTTTTAAIKEHDDLMIYGMYFQDVNNPAHFLDYHPFSSFPYSKLLSLPNLGQMFHSPQRWKSEIENTQQNSVVAKLKDGCDYFNHYGNNPILDQITISNAVDLCHDNFQLIQSPTDPLIYIIINKQQSHTNQYQQYQYQQHQYEGVKLRLFGINFKIDDGPTLYALSSTDLTYFVNPHNNKLPTTQQLKQQKQLFIPLSGNEQFTAKEMKTQIDGYKARLPSQTVGNENIIGEASFLLSSKHNIPEYGGSMGGNKHTDCNPDLLSTLIFIEISFILDVTTPKRDHKQHTKRYKCRYTYDNHPSLQGYQNPNVQQVYFDPYSPDGHHIPFNANWWEVLAQKKICAEEQQENVQGAYIYGMPSQPQLMLDQQSVCDIIRHTETEHFVDDTQRRRLTNDGDTESVEEDDPSLCNCIDACGFEWLIMEGNELTMQNCLPTVDALHFEWALAPSSSHYHHRLDAFDPKRRYNHRHWEMNENIDIIDGKHIPFYPCEIPPVKDVQEQQFKFRLHGREPQPQHLHPQARVEESGERKKGFRRRVLAEDNPSKGQIKDNFYLLIASTIFCIIVGIQSVYWLSHS